MQTRNRVHFIATGDDRLFDKTINEFLDYLYENEYVLIDIKISANEGQYLGLVIYKFSDITNSKRYE